MKNLIKTLKSEKIGQGHFNISIIIDFKVLETITTNTLAIDAAFDDSYNNKDNSGQFYENRKEAQEDLVNEILKANNYKLLCYE